MGQVGIDKIQERASGSFGMPSSGLRDILNSFQTLGEAVRGR